MTSPRPSVGTIPDEGQTRISLTRERINALRRITFPYAGLMPETDACDAEDVLLSVEKKLGDSDEIRNAGETGP